MELRAMPTFLTLLLVASVAYVAGHGFAKNPPSRSSMWRYGYATPVNYDDNQLFCGGFQVQYNTYGGKCGPCGDSYGDPQPRDNENGGKYGRGIITRNYTQGQEMLATFEITANHRGWIQFSLCKLNTTNQLENDACFVPLKLSGSTETKYYLPNSDVGQTTVRLQLPPNVICQRCVLQWHYHTGNTWGTCEDGSGAVGCGNQETFRTCSDIAILH
ncbi:uncharacterized protein LOC132193939 [Neocloeon triangulifer]|uniref:uncharacterized protein LOC132193939 n=1 Tax=Neocloeon triangulifer TaxID=2078957 RepID=UPI00286F99D4|nr:uncharacterized protein LOC132193939 [Neocloeon triangulifer]